MVYAHSPGSDENADVSFAEHVLEAAPMDNYVPGKALGIQHSNAMIFDEKSELTSFG